MLITFLIVIGAICCVMAYGWGASVGYACARDDAVHEFAEIFHKQFKDNPDEDDAEPETAG